MTDAREPLLSPDVLRRLEALELVSRRVRAGRMRGDRLSRRKGRGSEFADFRPYAAGDDLRFLDWALFARLERLFLRLFLEEEDLHVHLLVDLSGSMATGSPPKLLYATRVAAALGFVGLVNLDRVAVTGFTDRPLARSPVFRGRPSLPRLLAFLDGLTAGGPGDLSAALKRISLTLTGRGVVILVSDFLDKGGVADGLRFLSARHVDVCGIQVLAPEELDPDLAGDVKLTDVEDGDEAELTVTGPVLARYRAALAAFRGQLHGEFTRRGLTFLTTSTAVPFDRLVLNVLRGRGLVR
ncbi:MAG: DUF58 domain-containing protein [Gemmataceae bacterium]|nr:DUF58 domain-containing protein [Gemmataceae bacterium]